MILNSNLSGLTQSPFALVAFANPLVLSLAALGNVFTVTATGNFLLANPVIPPNADGVPLLLEVVQDAVGSHLITFDTKFSFSTDLPSPTLSTAAGAVDYLGFLYNKQADVWRFVGKTFGF